MAKIKNTDDMKCWRECRATGTLMHCRWECKIVVNSAKQAISYEVKHILSKWFSNHPFLEKWKVMFMQNHYINVYSCFVSNSQKLKTDQISFNRLAGSANCGTYLPWDTPQQWTQKPQSRICILATTWMISRVLCRVNEWNSQSVKIAWCIIKLP